MQASLSFQILLMRLFLRVEQPQILGSATHSNLSRPLLCRLMPASADQLPRPSVSGRHVLLIVSAGAFTEIGQSIVITNTVDVINLISWPASVHMHPRQSVGQCRHAGYVDVAIALCADRTRDISRLHSPVPILSPSENTRRDVVIEKLPQYISGYFFHQSRYSITTFRVAALNLVASGTSAPMLPPSNLTVIVSPVLGCVISKG